MSWSRLVPRRSASASCNSRSKVASRCGFSSGGHVRFSYRACNSLSSSGLIKDRAQDLLALFFAHASVPEGSRVFKVLQGHGYKVGRRIVWKVRALGHQRHPVPHPLQFLQHSRMFSQSLGGELVNQVLIFPIAEMPAHVVPIFNLGFEIPNMASRESRAQVTGFHAGSTTNRNSHSLNMAGAWSGGKELSLRFLRRLVAANRALAHGQPLGIPTRHAPKRHRSGHRLTGQWHIIAHDVAVGVEPILSWMTFQNDQ